MDGQWKKGIRTHVHYVIDGIIVAQIFWERPGECVASICNSSLSCVVLNSEAEAKLWCEKKLTKK